jgi:hypothetical protein
MYQTIKAVIIPRYTTKNTKTEPPNDVQSGNYLLTTHRRAAAKTPAPTTPTMLPDIFLALLNTGEEEAAAVPEVLLQGMEEVEAGVDIAEGEDIDIVMFFLPLPIPIPIILPLGPFFPT